MVTPECLATALVPLYVAGVLTARVTWPRRALALIAAPPLFAALAIARLLLLALPARPRGFAPVPRPRLPSARAGRRRSWCCSPCGGSLRRRGGGRGPPGAPAAALGAAAILAIVAGAALTSAVLGAARAVASLAPHTLTELTAPGDAQGALALLPAYQAGLLLALGMTAFAGWRRLLLGLRRCCSPPRSLLLVVLGELADHAGLVPHALVLRAWAVGVPVVLTLVMLRAGPPAAGTLAPLRPAADGPR